jgi:glyoxylase-like metal-dependent hydrolase (beta-lactamase superfamily II)
MHVETLPLGPFETNCHVLWGSTPQAIVIDPGAQPEDILDFLSARKLSVAAYLLTHGHVDHVSAVAALCDACPAPVHLHPADAPWAYRPANQMPPFYGIPRRPAMEEPLRPEEKTLAVAGFTCAVIGTPGHTPGSVCFHFAGEEILFSGDTLFAGSVGRTDLPGGDSRQLQSSLVLLARLPDRTTVYTGHGPSTTLAEEKRHNYFLQAACHRRQAE